MIVLNQMYCVLYYLLALNVYETGSNYIPDADQINNSTIN